MIEQHDDVAARIYEIVRALPPADRAASVARGCRGDAHLRARVETLLAAEVREPAAEAAPVSGDATTIASMAHDRPSARIGPYKLLQLIGEGGYGSVFMAEQQEPVERRVALKIVKLGMDTRQVIARFEAERQALALMDHPNIAKVFDAGATESGRPYFVMELVRGEPIVECCDRHNLTVDERLELFVEVCAAVQHAHTKGIIHRDIKPSNVLVFMQDDRPHVKVIDFGIAKAIDTKLTDRTVFTEHRVLIGTPEYMSPEQAEGSLDIDTRTDVYSLGVLLYELLTGSTPFDDSNLRGASHGDVQRIIREIEPPKPSTRLSRIGDTIGAVAAKRHTEPRRLGAMVRGELDWIVMKAMEKDRRRRYGTADALASDVRAHLGGRPVLAAPPSRAYRIRKFAARYRGPVVAACLVAVALVAGVIGTGIGLARALDAEREQRRYADAQSQERRIAEANEEKAESINQFLLTMLGSADLRRAGRDASVAQALDLAGSTVGTAFVDRPDVEAGIRKILGHTYLSLGMPEKAEPHVLAALDLSRRLSGEDSVSTFDCLSDLASMKRQRGDKDGAMQVLREATARAQSRLGSEHGTTLGLESDLANALRTLGQYDEAEDILRRILDVRTRVFGRDAVDTQIAVNSLAVLLHDRRKLDEAESLYREAADTGARVRGLDDPDTLTARMNLASVLDSRGRHDEAEALMLDTLARTRKVYGNKHPKTATTLSVVSGLYKKMGRFKDALPFCEESIAILREVQGENTLDVAEGEEALSELEFQMGHTSDAVDAQKRCVGTMTALRGEEHPATLRARMELATYLTRADQPAEAERIYRSILELIPRALPEEHPSAAIAINGYAVLLHGQGRFAEAEPLYRRALGLGRRMNGEDDRDTVITMHNLMCVERDLGRLDDAEADGRDVVARFERVFGPQHASTAVARASLAETLRLLGRFDDARAQLDQVVAIRTAALGEEHPDTGSALAALGAVRVDLGDAAGAEPLIRRGVEIRRARVAPTDAKLAIAKGELGHCLVVLGRYEEAEPLLVESRTQLAAAKLAMPRDILKSARRLAELYEAWDRRSPGQGYAEKAASWRELEARGGR
ncbi:MAG: serine/threonine-protein kinase [Phycisphaerales bacterium]